MGAPPCGKLALLRARPMERTIGELIASIDQGDPAAADALFAVLYDELHRMAKRELARRGSHLTLGATTLLHEAYLDLSGRHGPTFPDRARFMGYAAEVMRGVLIDYVRRRRAQKRGGGFEITAIDGDVADPGTGAAIDLEALSDALERSPPWTRGSPRSSTSSSSAASRSSRSRRCARSRERTVQRDWDKARFFLHQPLRRRRLPD